MNKKLISLIMSGIVVLSAGSQACMAEAPDTVSVYVSESGSDTGDGSFDAPFRTIDRAIKSTIFYRNKSYYKNTHINIEFFEGVYPVTKTVELNSLSGVTFKAYENSDVVLSGSVKLSELYCVPDDEILEKIPSAARGNIICADISELIDADEEAILPVSISSNPAYSDYLLFENNNQAVRAKWPNSGFEVFEKVYDNGANNESNDSSMRGYELGYDDERISSWTGDNIWVEGFGRYLWEYNKTKVAYIDTENNRIKTEPVKTNTGVYSGAKLCFSNVLEELDSAGEWYADEAGGKLYYYPSGNGNIEFCTYKDLFFDITNSENIRFEGLELKGTRGKGVLVENSDNIVFDNCTVSQIGKTAFSFVNTANCGVINSAVYNTGDGGISFSGGDSVSLADGNNYVENSVICRYDFLDPTTSGIVLGGVGNFVKNCTIFDAWQHAIGISGNNHKVIRNEIFDVVNGASDAGAIYSFSSSSSRGIEIRENYIHHLGVGGETASRMGVSAIYLDGWTSSRKIENNIFCDCVAGVNINGGSEIDIKNNLFIDTQVPIFAQKVDADAIVFWNALKNLNFNKDIWNAMYPEITEYDYTNRSFTYNGAGILKNNFITNNIRYNSGEYELLDCTDENVLQSGDTVIDKESFVDYGSMNFALTDEFYAEHPQIRELAFGEIGADIRIGEADEFALRSAIPVVSYNMDEIFGSGDEMYAADSVTSNNLAVSLRGEPELETTDGVSVPKNYIRSENAYYVPKNQEIQNSLNKEISFEGWINYHGEGETIFSIGDKQYLKAEKQDDSTYKLGFGKKFDDCENYWLTDTVLDNDTWYHVVVAYNGVSSENVPVFYINGIKADITQITHEETLSENIVSFGQAEGASHWSFSKLALYSGILDEIDAVRIYQAEKKYYGLLQSAEALTYNMDSFAVSETGVKYISGSSEYPLVLSNSAEVFQKSGSVLRTDNGCIKFPSRNYGYIEGKAVELLGGEFTVAMWVKPMVDDGQVFLNVGDGSYPFGKLYIAAEKQTAGDGKIKLVFARIFSGSQGYYTVNSQLSIGQWYHVAVVYSEENKVPTFYINGKSEAFAATLEANGEAVAIDSANDKIFINGTGNHPHAPSMLCYYGKVGIYDEILSGYEINSIYNEDAKSYSYPVDIVLKGKDGEALTDYKNVDPQNLTVEIAGTGYGNISVFDKSDDKDVYFEADSDGNTTTLKNISLGYGNTYIISVDGCEVEFSTLPEDIVADYKLYDDYSVSIYLTNNSQKDINAELYAAVHNNGILVSVKKLHGGTVPAGTDTVYEKVSLSGITDSCTLSLIMLDSISNLKPVIRKINSIE